MNELLKANYDNERITLSARELHKFLEIETPFKKWFGRMAEYGFQENIDFREVMDKIVQNPQGGRPSTDYEISIDSPDSIYIGDLAKLLKQNGISIGQNRLFEVLRNEGYLIKRECMRNEPTQRSLELGIMELVESTWGYSGGLKRINKTTFITGKGQIYFINKFMKKELTNYEQLPLWGF